MRSCLPCLGRLTARRTATATASHNSIHNEIIRSVSVCKSGAGEVCGIDTKTPILLSGQEAVDLWQSQKNSVKFVDASFHMNKVDRNSSAEYLAGHIPGAKFVDIDSSDFADKTVDLPHMMPSEQTFATSMNKLGISNNDHVVVYTCPGSFGAPRVWWMLKAFGHKNVSILNGGLNAWRQAGGLVATGNDQASGTTGYVAKLNKNMIADWTAVLDIVHSGSSQIVDARAAARFRCQAPEPRPGLPSGHIPGSLNVPFTSVVKPDDFTAFRSQEEIAQTFLDAGLIPGSKVVATCGSGVTAAVLIFGMHLVPGYPPNMLQIYDGRLPIPMSSDCSYCRLYCPQVRGRSGDRGVIFLRLRKSRTN
jgi:thiosulfate/3-mercaptopyruvate sulfurtransferase